jgi:CHAT domain-containing protein/predicted negative regulator of RcsB-dependent stress response
MAQPVFISYSSLDKDLAETLCHRLEAQDIRCWIAPRDVPPGAKWAEAIIHGIEHSVAMVLLFSAHVNASEQVMNEVERAVGNKKPIFPLRVGQVSPSQELAYFISRRHWLEVSPTSLDTVVVQLANAIRPLLSAEAPARLRGSAAPAQPELVFSLDVSRQGEQLKLSAYEHRMGQERPVRHYEQLTIPFASVEEEADAIITLLAQAASHSGSLAASAWQTIQDKGASLYQQLLTSDIRAQLQTTTATLLALSLDDALVHIPWELLFDGHTFLCRRFAIGRMVSTPQPLVTSRRALQTTPLQMLIVADPQGNLEAAAREGRTIRAELASEAHRLQVEVWGAPVTCSQVTQSLGQYDVLHYAGHATYDPQHAEQSGWLLADSPLSAAMIRQLGNTVSLPALVFSNACRSGQTRVWNGSPQAGQAIYGLANAFLLAGAQHYIGTFWDVPDEPSCAFAIDFYRQLAHGWRIGEALRRARAALAARYGEAHVVWGSYVLYGDPTSHYLTPPQVLTTEGSSALPVASRGEEVKQRPRARPAWLQKKRLALGAAALLLVGLALAYFWLFPTPTVSPLTPAYQALQQGHMAEAETLFEQLTQRAEKSLQSQGYVGLAAVALAQGDYTKALDLAQQAERLDAEAIYSYVIRGNVLLNQGKVAEATAAFRTATTKTNGLPWQQAAAYDRLGRIYAAQGEAQQALDQYDKAIGQRQDMAAVYANKAHLLDQLGKHQEALALYRQARQLDPNDPLTAALWQEAEQRQQLAEDQQRQQRLDQLVAELLQAHQEGKTRGPVGDGWTSPPLTLAFLDFRYQGPPTARAGQEDFLLLRMTQALQGDGRVAIVERALLDKLLTELKLSTSELADPQVALRVGRVLAARLIATGSFTYLGETGQFSVRLIETETTRVKAAATEMVTQPDQLGGVVEQVSQALLTKLRQTYPLQGRIVQITPEGIFLNIGAERGITPGLVFQVFGKENPLQLDGQVVGYRREPVGFLEVTSVEGQFAQAKVLQLEPQTTLQQGWKVQEVEAQ